MMINAELLQKLREPQIQAELRPLVEVGWWAYIVNLQSGFTGKGTWRLVTFVRRAPATIWIHNKIFNEGAYTLAPSTDWLVAWASSLKKGNCYHLEGKDSLIVKFIWDGSAMILSYKIIYGDAYAYGVSHKAFEAPTLHESLLKAWLWCRENVKEARNDGIF